MSGESSMRKCNKPGESDVPRVEKVDGVWRLRSTAAVRQVLRERDATTQAGFNSESMPDRVKGNRPILFMDGEEHRQQRGKTARFFAPKTVTTRYRRLMENYAEALVSDAVRSRRFYLDRVSLLYSVHVAAQIIGLTNSSPKRMARRLERFFDQPLASRVDVGRARFTRVRGAVLSSLPMGAFYTLDVRPAIRARQKKPSEDVISHLIAEGYSDSEILIECVTYGAAGMATTREFISMAAWHLLGDRPLRDRFLVAGERERHAILSEILRLEPIVGHLYRRATKDLEIADRGQSYTIRRGELIDLFIRQSNADVDTVGAAPLALCPGRDLPSGIGEEVLSFGDGAHKCPGNALAIQESDILLQRLLRHDLHIVSEPRVRWDDLIAAYSLRDFVLRLSV